MSYNSASAQDRSSASSPEAHAGATAIDGGSRGLGSAAEVAYAADLLIGSDAGDLDRALGELLNHVAATWEHQYLPLRQHAQNVARSVAR
ncbi:hypothetical protein [Streptomyces zaomyceticus]|uniref:hypothetical protein n=1 Tax=Streptomyces zaomyceticus TaxID=68286 RepID=UPI0036B286A0